MSSFSDDLMILQDAGATDEELKKIEDRNGF